MDRTARREKGLLEGAYRLLMKRNSVYLTFVIAGAFFAERGIDYGINTLWNYKNAGKLYQDIPVLNSKVAGGDEE